MMKQMRNKFKMSYLPSVSVLFFLLLLDTIVLADYENTWNSYFEQPCCNTNGPHHFRHHKGRLKLNNMLKLKTFQNIARLSVFESSLSQLN